MASQLEAVVGDDPRAATAAARDRESDPAAAQRPRGFAVLVDIGAIGHGRLVQAER